MEELKFIPVTMFLSGVILMYCGFKNVTPIDVIRGNVAALDQPTDLYSPYTNPIYAGIYNNQGPGLFV